MPYNAVNSLQSEQPTIVTQAWVPNAHEISVETVINMIVSKGICTVDELFEMERRIKEHGGYASRQGVVANIENITDRGRFPALKRKMSKSRWSRKLGSLLFGWKWKKVKKDL